MKLHFTPVGNPAPTASAQARGLDRIDDLLARRLLTQDLLPRLVTANGAVDIERPGVRLAQRLEADEILLAAHFSASRI
jgi:hypothetical protein